jgi:hypothetical protein
VTTQQVDSSVGHQPAVVRPLAYEAAKRAWIAANPAATADEYEQAMRAIAARYGL